MGRLLKFEVVGDGFQVRFGLFMISIDKETVDYFWAIHVRSAFDHQHRSYFCLHYGLGDTYEIAVDDSTKALIAILNPGK